MRRLVRRILESAGMSRDVADDFVDILARFRVRVALILTGSLLAPILELSLLSTLYVLLRPETPRALSEWSTRLGLHAVAEMLQSPGSARWLFVGVSLTLLILTAAIKVGTAWALGALSFASHVLYGRRILDGFIFARPMQVLGADRGAIANAAVVEAGLFGGILVAFLNLAAYGASIVLYLVVAGSASPGLLVIAGATAGVVALINRRGYRALQEIGSSRVLARARLMGHVMDVLNGYRSIRMEGGEVRMSAKIAEHMRRSHEWRIRAKRIEALVTQTSETLMFGAFLAVVVGAILFAIPLATLVVFLILISRTQRFVNQGQTTWMNIRKGVPSLNAVGVLLDRFKLDGERASNEQIAHAGGGTDSEQETIRSIELDRVSFSYPGGETALADVSLELTAGSRTLICGPSGHGKSTLVALACGLLAPTAGTVRYNQRTLAESVFMRFRSRVAYVAADLFLFRDSIRENLSLGGEIPADMVAEAARQARLSEFMESLAGGIDGPIGENGEKLSLGQRQRVLLARIFAKRPDVVFIDEGTNNLNPELEDQILTELLQSLPAEAIVVMIAHRAPRGIAFTSTYTVEAGRLLPLDRASEECAS